MVKYDVIHKTGSTQHIALSLSEAAQRREREGGRGQREREIDARSVSYRDRGKRVTQRRTL